MQNGWTTVSRVALAIGEFEDELAPRNFHLVRCVNAISSHTKRRIGRSIAARRRRGAAQKRGLRQFGAELLEQAFGLLRPELVDHLLPQRRVANLLLIALRHLV